MEEQANFAELRDWPDGLIRPVLAELPSYAPGVREVPGTARRSLPIAKLNSNEDVCGPFPEALTAIHAVIGKLNRYPDGDAHSLRSALAEKHGVPTECVAVCAGADAVIGYACLATLDPGDEAVTAWPSFPTYVLAPSKLAATSIRVPLRDYRLDIEAMLSAITERTKIVFLATPNNPTGTLTSRAELNHYFENVPRHVLTVLDQAYFEYVDDPHYADGVEEFFRVGRRVLVLRTFSKIYGLAGLRIGYGIGPREVVDTIAKVRQAFDVTSAGQDAALASLSNNTELSRRSALNRLAMGELEVTLRELGYKTAGPGAANFVYVDVGARASALAEQLAAVGVLVRPLSPFGAPEAIRITAGTGDELAILRRRLPGWTAVSAGAGPEISPS